MSDEGPTELQQWIETQRELTMLLAHDLRNPLAAVLANLNFLELAAPPDGKDLLEAIADIKLSTETLLRLIDNAVTLARLEGGGAVDVAAVSFVEVVRAGFDRVLPQAQSAGIALRFSSEPAANGATVRANSALLEQSVENLVGNAVQHVRRGREAMVSVLATTESVTLRLDDDGPAFGPVERDFSRDGQLELKRLSDARYSRGLALYLVGIVARALGGVVTVERGDGHGRVALTFPRG